MVTTWSCTAQAAFNLQRQHIFPKFYRTIFHYQARWIAVETLLETGSFSADDLFSYSVMPSLADYPLAILFQTIFSHNRLLLWSHQPLQHTNSGYICNLPRLNVDKTKISGWKYVCKHVTESASTLWPSNRGPFSQSVNSERNHHIFLGKGKRKYCILQNTWT